MEKEKDLVMSLPLQISALASVLIFASVSVVSFFLPFTLSHPQWLIGTIINTCLFLAALCLPKKYFIPLSILPSIGVLSRGILFGPLTMFLVYFLPFVWLGNLLLILGFKFLFSKIGFVFSVFSAAAVKFLFLVIISNVYFKFSIVPAVFLKSMGLNQLATALAGGLIAFILFIIYGEFVRRSNRAS